MTDNTNIPPDEEFFDKFEADCQNGVFPNIAEILQQFGDAYRASIFFELFQIELFYRSKFNKELSVGNHKENYVNYQDQIDSILHLQVDSPNAETIDTPVPNSRCKSKTIGPYRLLQKVGQGGMGEVWLAQQLHPVRRRVAIKFIKPDFISDETLTRFEAEGQALALMSHPNIAKIFDAGKGDDGQPYYVMEFVQGVPLTEFCDNRKLTIEERLALFTLICDAAHHAHQKGIIHRDLKPSNILVEDLEGKTTPKIIDFGLAKAVHNQLKLSSKTLFTSFGQVIGTVQYMSPEQAILDSLDIDTRCDVFSLGAILYELVTGTTPIAKNSISEKSLLEVLESIRTIDPHTPSARVASFDNSNDVAFRNRMSSKSHLKKIVLGELDWIVMRSIEKERTRRYQSAKEFGDDVRRFLNKEPVLARSTSRFYRVQKFFQKNRTLMVSLAVVLSCILAGLASTSYFAIKANSLYEAERQQSNIAKAASLEAEKRERETSRALAKFQAANGQFLMDRRDETGALSWFLKSLDTDSSGSLGATNKLRVGVLERKMPVLQDFMVSEKIVENGTGFFTSQNGYYVVDNADGSRKNFKLKNIYESVKARKLSPSMRLISFDAENEFAVYSNSTEIVVVDVVTESELVSIPSPNNTIDAKFSASGVLVVSGHSVSSNHTWFKAWDTNKQRLICEFEHPGELVWMDFKRDATHLFAELNKTSDDESVQSYACWELGEGKRTSKPVHFNGFKNRIVRDPSGKVFARLVRYPGEAQVFDAVTANPITPKLSLTPDKSSPQLQFVAFSNDSRHVALAGYFGLCCIWDLERIEAAPLRIRHDLGFIWSCLFSADGKKILTNGIDGSSRIWDTQSGEFLCSVEHNEGVRAGAFSPDGRTVASISNGSLCIWNSDSGFLQKKLRLKGNFGSTPKVKFSQCGLYICVGTGYGKSHIWRIQSPDSVDATEIYAPKIISPEIHVLSNEYGFKGEKISPTKKHLLRVKSRQSNNSAVVQLVDVELQNKMDLCSLEDGEIFDFGFSSDGSKAYFAATDYEDKIVGGPRHFFKTWDIKRKIFVGETISFHSLHQPHSAFSLDFNFLFTLTRSVDGIIARKWNTISGKTVGNSIELKQQWCQSISSNGVAVIRGQSNLDSALVDIFGEKNIDLTSRQIGISSAFVFSAFSDFFVSIDESTDKKQNSIRIYDVEGNPTSKNIGYNGRLIGVAFSPDCRLIALSHRVASKGVSFVTVVDIAGNRIGSFEFHANISHPTFGNSSTELFVCTIDDIDHPKILLRFDLATTTDVADLARECELSSGQKIDKHGEFVGIASDELLSSIQLRANLPLGKSTNSWHLLGATECATTGNDFGLIFHLKRLAALEPANRMYASWLAIKTRQLSDFETAVSIGWQPSLGFETQCFLAAISRSKEAEDPNSKFQKLTNYEEQLNGDLSFHEMLVSSYVRLEEFVKADQELSIIRESFGPPDHFYFGYKAMVSLRLGNDAEAIKCKIKFDELAKTLRGFNSLKSAVEKSFKIHPIEFASFCSA